MSGRNGHSDLAKLLLRFPNQEQKEDLKHVLSKKNYTQKTLIELLSHVIPPTQRAATYTRGVVSDTQVVLPLIELLQHEDPGLRSNAEQALWAIWFRSGNESVDAMLQEGARYIKKELYEDAIDKLTAVIQATPTFAEGYNQRAIARDPYHFDAFAGMGHCYLRLGHLRQALDAYQRALEINPNLFAIAHTILQIQVALQVHLEDDDN